MTKETKPVVDWELIERHYRAGILSNVQIGAECGVSEGAIRKRAKEKEWVKDLSQQIKARAADLVRRQEVRAAGTSKTLVSEKEIVEVNAQAASIILIAQKGSIKRSHALFAALMDELELTTANKALFEELGELLDKTDTDDSGKTRQDKLNEIYRKVISMPSRVDAAKKLVETLEKLVRMEREAFGIDKEAGTENPIDKALKQLADMKRNGIQPD